MKNTKPRFKEVNNMKNYELIAELMKQPAGMEVRFCGIVPESDIGDNKGGYRLVTSPISEIDVSEGTISLFQR